MPIVNSLASNSFMRTSVRKMQIDLDDLQRRLASGRKAENFSQLDKSSARAVVSMRNQLTRIESYTTTINMMDTRLRSQDAAMETMKSLADKVFNETIKFSGTPSEVEHIQYLAKNTFDTITSLMNTTADNGYYVFGGDKANQAPWNYNIPGGNLATIAANVRANAVGSSAAVLAQATTEVHGAAPIPGWYHGGQVNDAIFISERRSLQPQITADNPAFKDLLSGLAAIAFADPATVTSDYKAFIAEAGSKITGASKGITALMARNGVDRSILADEKALLGQEKILTTEMLSVFEADDEYATVTRLNEVKTTLETSYRVTAELRGLSLAAFL